MQKPREVKLPEPSAVIHHIEVLFQKKTGSSLAELPNAEGVLEQASIMLWSKRKYHQEIYQVEVAD